MKTILLLFVLLQIALQAQIPTQPTWLGMTQPGNPNTKYATLFEEGGGRYFFTATHWQPAPNETIIFGNGRKGVVKQIHNIRGGWNQNQYDISIGEFKNPVKAKRIKVWWVKPPNWIQNEIIIKGFAYEGEYVGERGANGAYPPIEMYDESLAFMTATTGIIKRGYSGSPVLFQNTITGEYTCVGLNCGYHGDPFNTSGGWVHLVHIIYQKFFHLFPQFLQPPTTPTMIQTLTGDGRMKVSFKGNPNYRMECSLNLQQGTWFPVEENSAFCGYEPQPGPGEQIFWYDLASAPSMFFRGALSP